MVSCNKTKNPQPIEALFPTVRPPFCNCTSFSVFSVMSCTCTEKLEKLFAWK